MSREKFKQELVECFVMHDDIFCECIETLDNYNGFADEYRLYYMVDLDDIFWGMSKTELLHLVTKEFNINDDFFYIDSDGLSSVDNCVDWYQSHFTFEEVADNVLDNIENFEIHVLGFAEYYDIISRYKEFLKQEGK